MDGIEVFGVEPNLFLAVVVVIGFMCGRIQGLFAGLAYGLIFDITVGRFIGTSVIAFMLIGYLAAVVSDRFYSMPAFYIFSLMAAAATVLFGLFYSVISCTVYGGGVMQLLATTLKSCIYNAVIIIPVMLLMRKTLSLCSDRKY